MTLTVLVTVLTVVLTLITWIQRSRRRRRRQPPGPWGLPVLGYLPWLDPTHPYKTLTALARRFGPVFSVKMGSVDCVVLADNNIIRDLFNKDSVSGRPPLYLFSQVMEDSGIIFSQSDAWREQRRFAGLAMRKQGLTGPGLDKWLSLTMEEMMELYAEQAGTEVDPHEILSHVVGNMMNQAIFSRRYDREDPQWRYLQSNSKEGAERLGALSPANFLPWLRFLPSCRRNFQFIKGGQARQFEIFEEITRERETHLAEGNSPDCLTDFYLQEVERRGDQVGSFTRRQLAFFQGDMFGAGTETSTNTIKFALLILSAPQYRHLLEEIRAEIDSECGLSRPALSHALPHLRAAILEVQRVRPVTPQGIPHGVTSPVEVGGRWVLEAGTMVMPLHWAVNTDPNLWHQPDIFQPARFLDTEGKLCQENKIFPFQVGKRRCLGEELGKSLIFLTLANIFQRFDVRLQSGVEVWDDPVHGFTLSPKPFKVTMVQRT